MQIGAPSEMVKPDASLAMIFLKASPRFRSSPLSVPSFVPHTIRRHDRMSVGMKRSQPKMLCHCNAHDIFSTMFISDMSSKVPSMPFGSAFCWPKLAKCSLRSFWSSFRLASTLVSVLSHVGRWMYLLACTSHNPPPPLHGDLQGTHHEGPCESS